MEVKAGYKQTDVGVTPLEWETPMLRDKTQKIGSGITPTGGRRVYKQEGRPFIRSQNVGWGDLLLEDIVFIDDMTHSRFPDTEIRVGDVFLNITGASIGRSAVADSRIAGGNVNQHVCIIRTQRETLNPHFLNYCLLSPIGQKQIDTFQAGGNRQGLNFAQVRSICIGLPLLPEQQAIVKVLHDADALLDALERLIAKKRDLKRAAMQQLLTGRTRLPGFTGEWEAKSLGEITHCLDNVRVPLNEAQREKMRGDYPYCGANGVLDFVNSYVIDDDIILMAEDGGYFDEYETRPIAYRMVGKCWVNNHAHILKAQANFDQGFIFYSLVHKNILPFLASGTRAKLNKSEMNRVEVKLPVDEAEQTTISAVLSHMDAELVALEKRLAKTKDVKQGMMQELLTGKVRLVSREAPRA